MAIEVDGWVYEVSSNEQREMLVEFVRVLFGEPITVLDADSDIATASKRR